MLADAIVRSLVSVLAAVITSFDPSTAAIVRWKPYRDEIIAQPNDRLKY